MFKKGYGKNLVVIGLTSLTIASANTAEPSRGFYVGASLGGAALTGDNKLTVSRINPILTALAGVPTQLVSPFTLNLSDKNINGDIFIGYGKRINYTYLGLELIGSLATLSSKKSMDIAGDGIQGETLSVKTRGAWGAAAKLGYFVNDATKLYLRFGIESRRFNIRFTSATDVDPFINLNKNFRATAFVPGFGAEVELTPRLAVRTEYAVALHLKSSNFNVTDPADAARYTTTHIKPTIHTFNIGLSFRI